jgi:hypothetical protein
MSAAADVPWRFGVKGSPFLSKKLDHLSGTRWNRSRTGSHDNHGKTNKANLGIISANIGKQRGAVFLAIAAVGRVTGGDFGLEKHF